MKLDLRREIFLQEDQKDRSWGAPRWSFTRVDPNRYEAFLWRRKSRYGVAPKSPSALLIFL
jgi:hypothetical protein